MLVLVIYGSIIVSVIGHEGEHRNHQRSMYLPEVPENKAKSFLRARSVAYDAPPDPSYCIYVEYESWCESHIPYCQTCVYRVRGSSTSPYGKLSTNWPPMANRRLFNQDLDALFLEQHGGKFPILCRVGLVCLRGRVNIADVLFTQQQENTREQRCTPVSCPTGQFCQLLTPCPAHFRHACIDIDECASSPCQHGGTCHNGQNMYTCTCMPGWTGHNCEIDIDECASTPCMYGNDCIQDRINSYICVCSERYEGVHCEKDCRPGPADVMFLVDTSLSQGETFNRTVDYMTRFVNQIPIGPNDFQVALVSYTLNAKLIFNFTTHSSNSSLTDALGLIKSERGPTMTSEALLYASREILNPVHGARLLSNVSHYVILLTNGLSTDRHQAITTARMLRTTDRRFKIFVVGVGEDVAHEELIQLPTDVSSSFSTDNDDLLMAMLKDATDYGCTDCNSSSVTDVIILYDTSKDRSPLSGNSLHSLKFIDRLADSFDMAHTDIRLALQTFNNVTQIIFDFHHISSQDMKARIYSTTIGNASGNFTIAVSNLKALFSSPTRGSRRGARKICYFFTNGKWHSSENSVPKQMINDLHDSGISVNVMLAIDDGDSNSVIENAMRNARNISFDPYRVYVVESDESNVVVDAATRETRYVQCPDDIFLLKH